MIETKWKAHPATWHRGNGPYKEAITAGDGGVVANVLNYGKGTHAVPKFGHLATPWTPPPISDHARLIEAAPDLYAELREQAAFLRRFVERITTVLVTNERSQVVNTYAAVQIPDWEVKQRLAELDELIAKAVSK